MSQKWCGSEDSPADTRRIRMEHVLLAKNHGAVSAGPQVRRNCLSGTGLVIQDFFPAYFRGKGTNS